MYSFSLASNRKSAISNSSGLAPPAAAHVIRAPSELKPHQRLPQPPNEADDDDDVIHVSNARFGWHPAHEHAPTSSLYAVRPPAEQLVHVHNLNAYMALRDAADWSVEVQREREQKKRRALAQHEAVKLEEQRHRDAQEEQTKKEMQQRRWERQQERAELREADAMADFQDRNTQFLQNQLWLMQLGSYVRQTDAQHKAHAREELHKSSVSRNHLDVGHTSTTSWGGTNVRGHHTSAPSTEIDLRQAAEATEEAYVRLSLAYRNEAQRSRAAAAILNPGELTGKGRSRPRATRSVGAFASPTSPSAPSQAATAVSTPPHSPAASPAPTAVTEAAAKVSAPFHTAPPMFTHTSEENMGQHANAIPYTYIPEYFDAPSAAATAGKVPAPRRAGEPPEQQETGAVMPLPLSPVPVSRDVTGALQARYYPWALYSAAAVRKSMLPPLPPPREASLPVRRWGAAELRDSMFGHCILEDGTIQDQCERKKMCAAYLGYTTLPRDNATATSNAAVEPQEPLHFGKRMDIWL
ncbi:conserved hypothetical protein [Leishmania infantum JPCM5]|uniref:Uncharacterized protein n=2 Tax=Leishmania infantum TaxID=5671 RepID=A4HU08_LEIIN|nr:conserved hypothetical protein [Leishmania infantum JPCM5]CAC9454582.1 hypothetical_protein_-__conserved [Leishmania infantum]CAM65914.1 conserved hypothetical protein [Leishmania infantum JPCM5]SUZ39541.1 hypothetical_protein_-__conserved [Leishmania infantum]|eukprot:XP_001463549.1 conserved hypothetical protein [Leishmania infantum JPCM5]